MIQNSINLPRIVKQLLMMLVDSIIVILCLYIAFYLRLGYWYTLTGESYLHLMFLASPLFALPIFFQFGLYRELIRYIGIKALFRIIKAVSLYSIVWGLFTFMVNIQGLPRSIILISCLLVILIIGASRLFANWLFSEKNANKILIYGAGSAGRQLATALIQSNEYKPVAFIDDDKSIYHKSINGIDVYSRDDIKTLIEKKRN